MEKTIDHKIEWHKVATVDQFPFDGGRAVKLKGKQIAIFQFNTMGKWYATDNMCPHKKQMILSRGIIGDKGGIPKVACPFHKKQFSLESGQCLDDSSCEDINVYPIKVTGNDVYVGLI